MSKDPRRRENGGLNIPPPPQPSELKQSILFGDADEEDVMDVDEAIPVSTVAPPPNALAAATAPGTGVVGGQSELISRIITPSPYAHHNSGPTSSRFRNALNRVTASPKSDVEAWQALITEVNACYRNVTNIHAVDAETYPRLDWIESCYGSLLKNFPYASTHYVTIIEMLLAQSARFGEENGPGSDYGMDVSRRSLLCESKVEHLFRITLGIEIDGTIIEDNMRYGMCVWVVELWVLYVRKAERDARRQAASLPPDGRDRYIREATTKAYEVAILQAGFSHNNQLIWKKYVEYVKSWLHTSSSKEHAFAQQQMVHLRSVYQRLVMNPMTGLDQLWQEYEAFERGQSEALAQALITEFAPKYQNARTCYLERNRVYSAVDLQLGRLATPPAEESDEDYSAKIEEEYVLLKLWKTRCSYERINPLRLDPHELTKRIRHSFKEMVCILTRHPESWHMWSTWELYSSDNRKAEKAIGVLQLGQEHIPDCTLLAFAEAQVLELHTDKKEDCMKVMEKFLERCPNTLAFVLYQKMVRRYRGKEEARIIFAKARRILAVAVKSKEMNEEKNKTEGSSEAVDVEGGEKEQSGKKEDDGITRYMVTNRLESTIGGGSIPEKSEYVGSQENGNSGVTRFDNASPSVFAPGPITWHLYAAHAVMEHRLNRRPDIAARVYELGLRKHSSFITIPPYVLRYTQLLLELNDTMNLRALLTRSVAACEAVDNKASLASMWDMNLHFESIINGADPAGVTSIQSIERRRREALLGPEIEDVGNGGFVGVEETALIGAQKSTLGEQLIRIEGYDISSRIVNGMNRTVDFLGIMGFWGDGDFESAKNRLRAKHIATSKESEEVISGGRSDATYQKRLNYQLLMHSGLASETAILDGAGAAGTKTLTARERLQQGAGASAAGPGQGTAIMLAIQQSPEWLQALLLLLPASKLRLPIVAKPPPHLTEMALSQLRQTTLPAERPADPTGDSSKRASSGGDGNSSDEDDGDRAGGSGYSSAFRARQRARIMENGSNLN